MSEEQIDAMLGAEDEDGEPDFLILPENWECVQVFCALGSRWKQDGMSGRFYGFERGDIVGALELMQITPSRYPQIFSEMLVMEQAALKVLNRE